jgi:PAS domain S-box-containing protein
MTNGLTLHVIVPDGHEAERMVAMLPQHGMSAEVFRDVTELFDANRASLGPLLIAEESLSTADLHRLGDFVCNQPAWSNLPILILTIEGSDGEQSQLLKDQHPLLDAPILLERPLREETLFSNLRAAVRARRQQYAVRDALSARDHALAQLLAERDTLRHSEERFRHLIENATVCINISDIYGHISYCNPTLLRLLGYSADDVQRGLVRWDELTPPEFSGADAFATAQLVATGTCDPYQKAYRARDGRLIPLLVGMFMLPSTDSQRPPEQVAVFLTDLTSQKQAEAALMQSEKLAAVGRLAASISHEINNPLEAVTNLLYLMRQEGGLSATMGEYLSNAELELARVSQIATQTLRFHRQSAKACEVVPKDLIQSVIGLYQGRLLNSNIEVVYQHRGAGSITCYEGDIRQVLNNLVSNAMDSMRTGGRLILRTRNCTLWRPGTKGMCITVADTGHGMSAEVRARIFEAFYSTKGSHGNGLGLWISKEIVEKQGARLLVKSSNHAPRTGSVFSLLLPLD